MIDAHVHFGSLPFKGVSWGSFNEYRKIAKKIGIKNYCTTPIGLPENFANKTTPDNSSLLAETKKDESLIPVYWFNVFDLPKQIDSRYKAIKFHPDLGKVPADDSRVVDFVNSINLPVFVHSNEKEEHSSFPRIISLAQKVKVPVVAVHSGSITTTFFKLDDYKFPSNVYFETSGIQYAIILKKIYKLYGAERIIFGSDYPFGDPRVPLSMLETLNLSKKEFNKVTSENIKSILKLN